MRTAPLFNAPVAAVATSPRLSRLVNRNIAILSYTGRRSGRSISTPVAYRRTGDEVVIAVAMPDAKTWWRNFLGDGAPSRCVWARPITTGMRSPSATTKDASRSPYD